MTRRLDGHRGITAGAILCLLALVVVSPALVTAPPARAEFREVSIADDEFEPPEIIIQQGDTVVWVHRGVRPHGVRATDGSFDSNPGCSFQNGESCMRNGDRYSRTFDQPGTFAYYCPVHGSANGIGMTGQISVASGGGGGGGTTTPPPPPPTTTTTRGGGTTVQPPTTAATTTQSPGGNTTSAPPGAPTTTVSGIPQDTAPVEGDPGTDNPVTTTLTLTAPGDISDGDDDSGNLLILVAAVIVLAAAVSATAWYYRPGARPPGGPPPPVTPL